MGNYAQNAANKRFTSPSQSARDLLAFRTGRAYTRLKELLGKGADDLLWAISSAPEPQRTEYAEMYMRHYARKETNDRANTNSDRHNGEPLTEE